MNKQVYLSSVQVGKRFEYKGQIYTRSTHNRGKQVINGNQTFTLFPKHLLVTELDAKLNLAGR
jgi:hypothetical protein